MKTHIQLYLEFDNTKRTGIIVTYTICKNKSLQLRSFVQIQCYIKLVAF